MKWEDLLPHAGFAYNRTPSKSTNLSPFEVVYGVNPYTPLDIISLPTQGKYSQEADKRAKEIKETHVKIKERNEKARVQANMSRKGDKFQPKDLVWIHLRKEQFPSKRGSKILSRSDGPFEIIEKVTDNAYKVDLSDEYGVSATFNVTDLSPYFDENDELPSLRTTSLKKGGMIEEQASRSLNPTQVRLKLSTLFSRGLNSLN